MLPNDLGEQLKAAIASRRTNPYQLAKAASIDRNMIARFLKGERDITLSTASKIATVLGLRLTEQPRKPAPKKPGPPSAVPLLAD